MERRRPQEPSSAEFSPPYHKLYRPAGPEDHAARDAALYEQDMKRLRAARAKTAQGKLSRAKPRRPQTRPVNEADRRRVLQQQAAALLKEEAAHPEALETWGGRMQTKVTQREFLKRWTPEKKPACDS